MSKHKGRRRGSKPWKPGVRSLTSADPKRKRSYRKPRAPAWSQPPGPPKPISRLNGLKWNRENWLTDGQYQMIREALAKRV